MAVKASMSSCSYAPSVPKVGNAHQERVTGAAAGVEADADAEAEAEALAEAEAAGAEAEAEAAEEVVADFVLQPAIREASIRTARVRARNFFMGESSLFFIEIVLFGCREWISVMRLYRERGGIVNRFLKIIFIKYHFR